MPRLALVSLSLALLACGRTQPFTRCVAGSVPCDGECATLTRDSLHCGACGAACAVGSRCSSGACVAVGCNPGETRACYEGPGGTAGTGTCRSGLEVCGSDRRFGECEGQILPRAE